MMRIRFCGLLIATVFLVIAVRYVSAQEAIRALPEVVTHQNPVYPPLARQARIEGRVGLRIVTDGQRVTNVTVLDGHPLLAQTAKDNVQTWTFANHVPGTFEATFDFKLLSEGKTTFQPEMGVVDVAALPPPEYDENSHKRLEYTLPTSWDLELKTAKGDIAAPLTLWTYGPWLRGYTLGRRKQERVLGNAHIGGDMLGFDVALDDSHGQRLQFSLIGKKDADKMLGIFLDAWGTSGTWTAVPSKAPIQTCAAPSAAAEENVIPVPEITQHQQPRYPGAAWEAHIQGQVRMHVTTDTYCVAKITTQSSEPLLTQAAEANVRTWLFGFHKPGTFDMTFKYRFLEPAVSFLEKPGVVQVWSDLARIGDGPQSGLWNDGGYKHEIWKAIDEPSRTSRGDVQLPLWLLRGREVTHTKGGKAKITQGYRTVDEVGFSTTLKIGANRPTRVSLIGTLRGDDRIEGVFLDESGTSGTWSAQMISRGHVNLYLRREANAENVSEARLDYPDRRRF